MEVLIHHDIVLLTKCIKLGPGVILSYDLGVVSPGSHSPRVRSKERLMIASLQANGCTHDTSKKTLEMILQEKICPLFDLFVLNSLSEFVNNVVHTR